MIMVACQCWHKSYLGPEAHVGHKHWSQVGCTAEATATMDGFQICSPCETAWQGGGPGPPPPPEGNRLTDAEASFEDGTFGRWEPPDYADSVPLSVTTDQAYDGTRSLTFTARGGGEQEIYQVSGITASPGERLTASLQLRSSVSEADPEHPYLGDFFVGFLSEDGLDIGSTPVNLRVNGADTWTRNEVTTARTAPDGPVWVTASGFVMVVIQSAGQMWIDDVDVRTGPPLPWQPPQQPPNPSLPTTLIAGNLLTAQEQSFEGSGTGRWAAPWNSGSATLDSARAYDGGQSLTASDDGNGGGVWFTTDPDQDGSGGAPVTPGMAVTFSAMIWVSAPVWASAWCTNVEGDLWSDIYLPAGGWYHLDGGTNISDDATVAAPGLGFDPMGAAVQVWVDRLYFGPG